MFVRPRSIAQAASLLSESNWTIIAGGTDFYPGLRDQAVSGPVMDISAIDALRTIEQTETHWRIGALATWTDVITSDLPPAFDALKQAAHEVGSVQIQNRATIVGNLCNASPAADGMPPLLCVNAMVELSSIRGKRTVELAEFVQGNRRTMRRTDEIVTAILVPVDATSGKSAFLKLGSRKYLVISIAMIAARVVVDQHGRIAKAAVAIGACSEVAMRLTEVENSLVGMPLDGDVRGCISAEDLALLRPIDDVRAGADYRRHAALELVCHAIEACREPVARAA